MKLIYCNPSGGAKARLQRRKAIKQPSSRGLCLKVTLGGQIDGISDGANGLESGVSRDTEPHTAAYVAESGRGAAQQGQRRRPVF